MKKLAAMLLTATLTAGSLLGASVPVMAEESDAAAQTEENQEADSVTVTDLEGREVTVQLPIQRAYLGFYYESFLTVVGDDAFTKVVATSLYDTEGYFNTLSKMYKEYVDGYADMTDVGSTMQDDFDLEKLIELDCDVVLLAPYQYSALEDKIDLLEKAGIPVVVIDYGTATEETHMKSTEVLGKLFQVEDRAEEICNTYEEKMASVKERIAEAEEANGGKKTCFHEFDSTINSYSELGVSDFTTFLAGRYVTEAGADDIVAGVQDGLDGVSTTLDMEYVMEQDPDTWFIIGGESTDETKDGILMGYGVTEDQTKASAEGMIEARPGWDTLNMVKNDQIYCVENGLLRTLRDYIVIEYMAKCMYPDQFEDVDPDAELLEFSEKYLSSLPTDGVFFYHYDPEA